MEIECHLICILNLFSFNLYPNVGREDAQAEFGTVDLLCIICGGGFESLCGLSPPHLSVYLFIQTRRNKVETNKGSASLNTGMPKFIIIIFFFIILLLVLLSINLFHFFI